MYGISENSYWFFWDRYIQEEHKLSSEMLGLRKQIKSVGNTIEKTKSDLNSTFHHLRKNITDKQHLDAIDSYEEDQSYGNYYMEQFLYNSNCLLIYSYCEGKLKELCLIIDKLFNIENRIKENNSRDSLKKYYNHLKKSGLKVNKVEKHLTKITQQRVVRIAIAHHNGELQNPNPFPIWDGLNRDGNIVRINNISYLESLVNEVELLFTEILKSIAVKNQQQ